MPGRARHPAGRRLPRRDAGPRRPLAGDRPPPDGGRTAHCPATATRPPSRRRSERLAAYADRVTLVHSNFSAARRRPAMSWASAAWTGCSLTSAFPRRSSTMPRAAFPTWQDAPLDMRMDESDELHRAQRWSTPWQLGGAASASSMNTARSATRPPIATKPSVAYRTEKPIETTLELADLIRSAMPAAALREKQHPAKRSFQAIRIAVNDELGELPPMLQRRREESQAGRAAGGHHLPFARGPHRQARAASSSPRAAPVRRSFRCACAAKSPK